MFFTRCVNHFFPLLASSIRLVFLVVVVVVFVFGISCCISDVVDLQLSFFLHSLAMILVLVLECHFRIE